MRVLLLLLLFLAAAPATQPTPAPLAKAREILATMKESHYSHKTSIDESAGTYDVDCSGFICYLLSQAAPDQFASIPHRANHRPLALNFYDAFSATPPPDGWAVVNPCDALPGDIIAWRKVEQIKGQDTGHVMIINSPPIREETNLLKIEVIDSTASRHFADSRPKGADGIGKGTLWLILADDGHATGFHWSSRTGRTVLVPIAIGRLAPQNQR